MKELAVYFKKRMKEKDNIPKLSVDRNYSEEIEYNIDHEIESRKTKLTKFVNRFDGSIDEQTLTNVNTELKFLKIYNLQKKVRRDVMNNFLLEFDKQNSVYYSDTLFQKTLLDRRFYKKPNPTSRKDQKLNDRFEQQLRNGYDLRKKDKQRDFLNTLLQHQREFMEYHRSKKQQLRKRVQQAKGYLDNREKKDFQEKERKEKERLILLKKNDFEGYVKYLNETKETRLIDFIKQTDLFLKEIEDKIQVQKEVVAALLQVQDEENNMELDDEARDGEEKTEEMIYNSKKYYTVAHSIMEDIKTQPKMLKHGNLKSYQLIGLQWLVSLYVNNLNGILADEMGLGKTIQTIALICYLIERKQNPGPYLIVVPLSTLSNWVLEFSKWAPDVKIGVYKGTPNYRRQLAFQIKNDREDRFNVLVTTYEYIMKDKYYLNKITWQYIIVDEGHRMKNFKSKFTQTLGTQFNSVYRLLLTGTPLQNNLAELWALLNFLLPKIFNSCDEFEKWFNQPFSNKAPTGEKPIELTEEEQMLIIHRLHTVLRPFLLRREKKEVEKELPNKIEYVIKVELSAWQRIVYNSIQESGLLNRDPSTGKMGAKALMNTMMQLRKICNHPYMFLDYNNKLLEHINEMIIRSSGKFELLDRILDKLISTGHKVLIFSQMTHLMDILQLFLDYKGLRHLRLDGNTKADDRGTQMEIFNNENSEYKIFILSTRAGGLGLNLQAADTVIIFDSDWNPQMDIQAQDRAHRIGQKQEVKVLRLITRTDIEEEILSKAAFKKNLDDKIIRAGLYNAKYSEQERRKKLQDLLKNEEKEEESGDEDEIPSDEQINEMISRSDDEFIIFQRMDQERYESERKEERINEILKKGHIDVNVTKHFNYRLMQEYEVPEWVIIKTEKEQEMVLEEGKRMRAKQRVNYNIDHLDEFDEDDSDMGKVKTRKGKQEMKKGDDDEFIGKKRKRLGRRSNNENVDEGEEFISESKSSRRDKSQRLDYNEEDEFIDGNMDDEEYNC
jgi:ATP-dependent helicase STH1/SNF2